LGSHQGLPPDKAPGHDRFTTSFLQAAWDQISLNIMAVVDTLWRLDTSDLHAVKDTLLILLPKSPEASTITDYRPISLIHLIGKLISKILANCLAPRLNSLVHSNQSAFVKGRSIHDSFRYVQASARQLFLRKKPSILFKVDISKAFDLVAWSFLMELLG
jgi:hypothetical protein